MKRLLIFISSLKDKKPSIIHVNTQIVAPPTHICQTTSSVSIHLFFSFNILSKNAAAAGGETSRLNQVESFLPLSWCGEGGAAQPRVLITGGNETVYLLRWGLLTCDAPTIKSHRVCVRVCVCDWQLICISSGQILESVRG